jgi:hypothetical protein
LARGLETFLVFGQEKPDRHLGTSISGMVISQSNESLVKLDNNDSGVISFFGD